MVWGDSMQREAQVKAELLVSRDSEAAGVKLRAAADATRAKLNKIDAREQALRGEREGRLSGR